MKRKVLCAVTALVFMGGVATTQAQSYDDRWYLSAGVYGNKADEDRLTENFSVLGALGIGKYISHNVSLELFVDHVSRDFNRGADGFKSKAAQLPGSYRSNTIGLDARWLFGAPDGWRSYLLAGVGASETKISRAALREDYNGKFSEWGPMVELGFGAQTAIGSNLGFRAEAKYRYAEDKKALGAIGALEDTKRFGEWIVGVGLTMALGAAPAEPMPEPAAPPPPVEPHCSELDDDGDGVNNCDDLCPNTAAGTIVGPDGCPLKVVIDLRGVNFKFDRPSVGESNIEPTLQEPTSDSISILEQAIDALNRYPEIRVELHGHTDSVGTDEYNQRLSERRAQIVNDYLLSHGIDASRIVDVRGYGESQPIDTNDTREGRARNRRTELNVIQ